MLKLENSFDGHRFDSGHLHHTRIGGLCKPFRGCNGIDVLWKSNGVYAVDTSIRSVFKCKQKSIKICWLGSNANKQIWIETSGLVH